MGNVIMSLRGEAAAIYNIKKITSSGIKSPPRNDGISLLRAKAKLTSRQSSNQIHFPPSLHYF